jgi:hypothetical protein
MAKHKTQHTVQKAYLEGFAARGLPATWKRTKALWVCSLQTGQIRLRSIDRVAVRPYYYSFIDKDSEMNPLIENWFQPVEKDFARFRAELRDLVADINLGGSAYDLDPRYREVLAEYLLINMVRVPRVFEQIIQRSRSYHRSLAAKGNREYDDNPARIMALRVLIGAGRTPKADIPSALRKRNLAIEFFPRTRAHLCTSDSPVIMHDSTRPAPGLAYPSTQVFFALDSSIFLRLWGSGNQVRLIKHRDLSAVDEVNYLIGVNADKELYCSDPVALRKVAEQMQITPAVREPGERK